MPRDHRHGTVAGAQPGTEGQHECARADWCTGYRLVLAGDGTSKRAPGLTYQAFCTADTALIGEQLGELPFAYGRLQAGIGDPVRRSEMIRVPFGPVIPLSEYYDGLMRQIAPELCAWAARVRAVKSLSPPPQAPVLSLAAVGHAAATLGRNLSALLALQPGWMTRIIPRPPGRGGGPPSVTDLEDRFGDCEIVRFGVDSVTIMVQLGGTDAGLEILDLHRKCQRALGEAAPRPEILDGVPCRVCGVMGLERAEPPPDPKAEADYSRCPALPCGDRMNLETYRAWVKRYEAWAKSAGPLACQRCEGIWRNGTFAKDHEGCIYDGCSCAAQGHREAA
jgi:hypothetical protein